MAKVTSAKVATSWQEYKFHQVHSESSSFGYYAPPEVVSVWRIILYLGSGANIRTQSIVIWAEMRNPFQIVVRIQIFNWLLLISWLSLIPYLLVCFLFDFLPFCLCLSVFLKKGLETCSWMFSGGKSVIPFSCANELIMTTSILFAKNEIRKSNEDWIGCQ